jgi:L-lactate dehydrogenase complex protein LldG
MSDPVRESFLARVRQAVQEGNRAGQVPALPERGSLGYQGGGADPVARFVQELATAGGVAHLVPDAQAATATLLDLLAARGCRRILLGSGRAIDALDLASVLTGRGLEVVRVRDLTPSTSRDAFFAADVGITGVEYLIAETGSLIVETDAARPRSESLLPPLHFVIAERSQLLADLFDAFPPGKAMPSCLTIITGPSKTGDIELRLVTGVHGPGEVHVILIDANENVPARVTN